jgi:Cu(I)-responsive transcriptional regulator
LPPAPRRDNLYRDYGERDVNDLRFIRRARKLGFSIEEIAGLLALWRDENRPSGEVRRIALAHVRDLETRVVELQGMIATLGALIDACPGDATPDCPILTELGN